MMILTCWIINTANFLPDLLCSEFVQINPKMPSSPDADTGFWHWATGTESGELTYRKMICDLPPYIYMDLKTFLLVTVIVFF